jgi:hypothetical protein
VSPSAQRAAKQEGPKLKQRPAPSGGVDRNRPYQDKGGGLLLTVALEGERSRALVMHAC